MLDMKADTYLTYDLNEAWVVHTIKCGDLNGPCRAGDLYFLGDCRIGGATLAGQSGRVGSPRGKVDGYCHFHAGCDSCGAIND